MIRVLFQAFINAYNIVVDNLGYFVGKWKGQVEGQDILGKIIAKRFIAPFQIARPIDHFNVDNSPNRQPEGVRKKEK